MLNFEAARQRILALAGSVGSERVTLLDAVGRVLAEDVIAPRSLPRAPTSAMDGYAVRAADLGAARPYGLAVLGESRAGLPWPQLAPHSACRIFTGATLPAGADSVVIQEDVRRTADRIEFDGKPDLGQHVRQPGEDLLQGVCVLPRGTRLNAFGPGLLAAVERQSVLVAARPRVAVLCSGDELYRLAPWQAGGLAVSEQPIAEQHIPEHCIPESNGSAIAALVRAVGGDCELLPTVGDDPHAIAAALGPALERCDVVFTIGGVSVGDHDRVREGLALAGAAVEFYKVRIKPGKPLTVATRGRCRVLGLPGNPVSAQVTFCLFGAPLLRATMGDSRPVPSLRTATLAAPIRQKPGRTGFYRVRVEGDRAVPLQNQSSGSAVSLAQADALAVVDADSTGLDAGQAVPLLWLNEI